MNHGENRQGMPLVSLVTPVYNGARHLRQTIDSVLAQDYPYVEYIVLDDGSTDETQQILAEYTGRIRWETQSNMGPASTLNKGWAQSRGQLLGYINADDVLFPEAISQLVNIFLAQPDVKVVYPNMNIIDADDRIIKKAVSKPFDYQSLVVEQQCYIGPGALFQRSVFVETGGWKPYLRLMPDREFWMRVGLTGQFVMHPGVLANYRIHPAAISYYYVTDKAAAEHIKIIDEYFKLPNIPADILAQKPTAFANAYLASSCSHLKGGRLRACWQQLKLAKEYNPQLNYFRVALTFTRALAVRLIHKFSWLRVIAARVYEQFKH